MIYEYVYNDPVTGQEKTATFKGVADDDKMVPPEIKKLRDSGAVIRTIVRGEPEPPKGSAA